MRNLLVILSISFCLSFSAQAYSDGCYTAREFEAEQGLRIDSELMVIGLTCLKMPKGQDKYRKYEAFISKNQNLLAEYETDMIGYYQRQGAANPEENLHTLRTTLANGISKQAIQMSTLTFCQQFGTRMDKALAMDQPKLRRWAQHVWPQSPVTRPMCRSGA